ncbi:MAG: FtsW/RodA/SpoVE family cell cycle protein [Anaerolineales bacterium]|jgi:rod shape determining protein RodA
MEKVNWKHYDFWLLGSVLVLTIFGVAMIRSAVANNIELVELDLVQRQLIFAGAGLIASFVLAWIDYHLWSSMSHTLYAIMVGILIVLFVVGAAFFGSARWFETGLFGILFQPSEVAKIVMILVLATFFSRNQDKIAQLSWIGRSFLIAMGIIIWILLQPNLSTSIVLLVIWFALLWASGLRLKIVLGAAAIGLAFAVVAIPLMLNPNVVNDDSLIKPYQVQRITQFLFPEEEASYGETYNVNQARITIGSGGLLGKGYGQGTQTQLRFLKVRWSDFIYASMAEEFGFIGTSVIMVLLFFIIWRIFRAARLARDTFGALICYGVGTWLSFQAIVNMGMNLNLLPVTGLPLPFVSYGGSALLSMFVGIGLVQSVILRHKALDF